MPRFCGFMIEIYSNGNGFYGRGLITILLVLWSRVYSNKYLVIIMYIIRFKIIYLNYILFEYFFN